LPPVRTTANMVRFTSDYVCGRPWQGDETGKPKWVPER
jgi:hypothetical protein